MQAIGLRASVRVTWLSRLLLDFHPFRSNAFAPITWAGALWLLAAFPLVLSGQAPLAFSRPILVAFVGDFCALSLGYLILLAYRTVFRDLRFAIQPNQLRRVREIRTHALHYINDDQKLSYFFLIPTVLLTLSWLSLAFYGIFPRSDFAFFYFLSDDWYASTPGKFYRLLSLYFAISASVAILCTGIWFQLFHWRMFQKLLDVKLVGSPILIYQGFAKLWAVTNTASIGLLSLNLFALVLLNFRPHPMQIAVLGLLTLPGALGVLWPTFRLYKILIATKTRRVAELLGAADNAFVNVTGARRLLAYSNVYGILFLEKNVGNMQAAISFIIASVSFLAAMLQIFGLDIAIREIIQHNG